MPFPMTFWQSAVAPPTGIAIGRSASAGATGSGGNVSLGFSGGAAANGVWVVCFALDNEYSGSAQAVPSGGSAWTRVGTSRMWYKQCGGSEPANYSISFSGSSKGDYCSASIIEILNSSGVDGTPADAVSTLTSPSPGTSIGADSLCILGVGDTSSAGSATPPTGYTTRTSRNTGVGASSYLAVKENVGAGTITPGAWTSHSYGTWVKLASILFKA